MKKDPRVDAYIAHATQFARPILRRLRAAVHAGCPKGEETLKWGMPFFTLDGRNLCFMAAFKAHAGFGFWRGLNRAVLGAAARPGEGMGTLGRIESPSDLPSDATLRGWVRKAARLGASTTLPRPKSSAKRRRRDTKTSRRTP
ncbi:MAG: DUF1801 domain-containing protein [Thermoanaerobaculia bacterium]